MIFPCVPVNSLLKITPRKRTVLISTAPFLSGLNCETLTLERRLKGRLGFLALWNCGTSFSWFCVVFVLISGVRLVLRKLQEMKSIQMVKKYRDRRGRHRVATRQTNKINQTCQSPAIIKRWHVFKGVHCSQCAIVMLWGWSEGFGSLASLSLWFLLSCLLVALCLIMTCNVVAPLYFWWLKKAHWFLYGSKRYDEICIYIYMYICECVCVFETDLPFPLVSFPANRDPRTLRWVSVSWRWSQATFSWNGRNWPRACFWWRILV